MKRLPLNFSRNSDTGQYIKGNSKDVPVAILNILKKHSEEVKKDFIKLIELVEKISVPSTSSDGKSEGTGNALKDSNLEKNVDDHSGFSVKGLAEATLALSKGNVGGWETVIFALQKGLKVQVTNWNDSGIGAKQKDGGIPGIGLFTTAVGNLNPEKWISTFLRDDFKKDKQTGTSVIPVKVVNWSEQGKGEPSTISKIVPFFETQKFIFGRIGGLLGSIKEFTGTKPIKLDIEPRGGDMASQLAAINSNKVSSPAEAAQHQISLLGLNAGLLEVIVGNTEGIEAATDVEIDLLAQILGTLQAPLDVIVRPAPTNIDPNVQLFKNLREINEAFEDDAAALFDVASQIEEVFNGGGLPGKLPLTPMPTDEELFEPFEPEEDKAEPQSDMQKVVAALEQLIAIGDSQNIISLVDVISHDTKQVALRTSDIANMLGKPLLVRVVNPDDFFGAAGGAVGVPSAPAPVLSPPPAVPQGKNTMLPPGAPQATQLAGAPPATQLVGAPPTTTLAPVPPAVPKQTMLAPTAPAVPPTLVPPTAPAVPPALTAPTAPAAPGKETMLVPHGGEGKASFQDWNAMHPEQRKKYRDEKEYEAERQLAPDEEDFGPQAQIDPERAKTEEDLAAEEEDFPRLAAQDAPGTGKAKIDPERAKKNVPQARQKIRDETGDDDEEDEDSETGGGGPKGNKFFGGIDPSALSGITEFFNAGSGGGGLGGITELLGSFGSLTESVTSVIGSVSSLAGGLIEGTMMLIELAVGGTALAPILLGIAGAALELLPVIVATAIALAPLIALFAALAAVVGGAIALFVALKIGLAATDIAVDFASKNFTNAIHAASEGFSKLAHGDLLGVLATGVGAAIKGFESVGTTITGVIPIIGGTLTNVLQAFTGAIQTVIGAMTGFVGQLLPLVAKISPSTSQNYDQQVANLQATLGLAFTGLVATMAETVTHVAGALLPLAEEFGPMFTELGGILRSFVLPAFKLLGALVGSILSPLRAQMDNLRTAVAQAVKGLVIMAAAVARLFGANDFVERLQAAFARPDQAGATAAGPASITGFEEISKSVAAAATQASVGAGGAADPLERQIDIMTEIRTAIGEIRGEGIEQLLTRINTMFEELWKNLKERWDKFVEDLGKWADEKLGPVMDAVWARFSAWFIRTFPNLAALGNAPAAVVSAAPGIVRGFASIGLFGHPFGLSSN